MVKFEVDTENGVHESILKIINQKFEIFYDLDESGLEDLIRNRKLEIEARLNELIVATSDFLHFGEEAYCSNVKVNEQYRCRGLANSMYVLAELLFDQVLSNYWENSPTQTESAKKLWNQPNRPFGNIQ